MGDVYDLIELARANGFASATEAITFARQSRARIGRLEADAINKRALAKRLAPIYLEDKHFGLTRATIAWLCDRVLDPGGNLLGYVRDEAFPARAALARKEG